MTLAIHKPRIAVDQILDQKFMFCKGKVNVNALEAQALTMKVKGASLQMLKCSVSVVQPRCKHYFGENIAQKLFLCKVMCNFTTSLT